MEKLLDFKQIKKYLKVSRATMYRLVKDKKIPGFKVGGQWRFRKDRIEKWLEDRENINSK